MLSSGALDGLLSVVSAAEASFASLLTAMRARFHDQADATTFHARCACAMLLDGGADQATLRPHQRLAALYIMARHEDQAPAAAATSHLAQLARNPFLEVLTQQLDRCEAILPATGQPAPLKPSPALLERCFLLQLLLQPRSSQLDHASPRSWSEHAATYVLRDPHTLQSAIAPSPLAEALAPIRQLVRENQPPAALLPPPSPLLHADLIVSAAHLTAVLGTTGVASLQSALSPAPSAAPASSLSLRIAPAIPRLAPPPILDIEWEALAPGFGPEVTWMRWDPPADLVWDLQPTPLHAPSSPMSAFSPLTPTSTATPFAQLLTKAFKSQLLAAERSQLLQELKAVSSSPLEVSPALGMAIQLVPPSRLPQLVEKNHEIARELLLQLMTLSFNRTAAAAASSASALTAISSSPPSAALPFTVNEYLSPLVQMDMSLHSMELVKDLALVDQVALPGDFLHLYICKCLSSCSKLSDKFLQNRHVRLICVFLQALMRHKIIQLPAPSDAAASATGSASPAADSATMMPDVRDVLLVEVQSFLVEFSRIKEAANLYKLIQRL